MKLLLNAIFLLLFLPSICLAAIAVRATSVGTPTTSDSINVTAPSGMAEGDLLIAQVACNSFEGSVDLPSGWTQVGSENRDSSGDTVHSRLMYKEATASDVTAGSFTFTVTTSVSRVTQAAVIAITGHDSTTPIGASNGAVASSGSVTTTGVTPTVADSMLILFVAKAANTTHSGYTIATSDPGGWTEEYDSGSALNNDLTIAAGQDNRTETTATGTSTITSGSSQQHVAHIVALSPSAGGGGGGRRRTLTVF